MALLPVMIRVPPGQWEVIRKLAERDEVSMSEYVRRIISRSLAQKGEA